MRIVSIKHKGLKKFLMQGDERGIRASDRKRLFQILVELIAVPSPLLKSSLDIHHLTDGRNKSKKYAVRASGSWRLTFLRDHEKNIVDLDYVQYH